ncbi:cupin domain-containing protein [Microbacterium terricola]|uniref:Cupin n=1 Tax=Microbacterium terricola TaxID=344163 RepID=A0ABM8E202_9MICO|nr:cupin domain-containing protein [Microbacterium terricola]UYK40441.1 cupin domain-containing protein [Microbacterium terricola]BDV31839.1 cupin [Microbacterium terricola]
MTALTAGAVTDAAGLTLGHEPVPAEQVVAGTPSTGYVDLDDARGVGIGVWEMTPGAMSDVESDEVFIVLSGSATVEFTDPALPAIELRAGSIVRLEAGMHTVWTVRETLRKVYVAG